ncbi:hypothetical protein TI39_contig5817g00015 [Lecanosticta acicola]|uniref:DNA (cytosine-5-)-methyltransferase n=1 Tax=Lecanosticta acicola TaxID=111012 RepID=A0AAI9EDI0_9PEZI|nr:hypothetical protein TI39_contig5817g00015 [Lecanosticta acicola]
MKRRSNTHAALRDEDDEIVVALHPPKRMKIDTSDTSGSGILTPQSGNRVLRDKPAASSPQLADSGLSEAVELDDTSDGDGDRSVDDSETGGSSRRRRIKPAEASHLAICGPAYPRSAYTGWQPPLAHVTEVEADDALREVSERPDVERSEWKIYRLSNFSFYRPPSGHKTHRHELVSLDRLRQDRYPEFCMDGILSCGDRRCYVQCIPFEIITVDGYGDDASNIANQICIQSKQQASRDNGAWYQLSSPAAEYRRFYHPFLWLARFTKYFVIYLLEKKCVTLGHFRASFFKWLQAGYAASRGFHKWLEYSGLRDFRTTVAANVWYLWKECYSLEDSKLRKHPIWSEVDPQRLKAIPMQPNFEKMTVVTPFAYQCFGSMYFGDRLVERRANARLIRSTQRRKSLLGLTPFLSEKHSAHIMQSPASLASSPDPEPVSALNITAGDVVCVRPDLSSVWREAQHSWFAYVQGTRSHNDRMLLDVLWLYEPKDTTLGKAYYPFPNELFLSDNCSCGEAALDRECVIKKAEVTFFGRNPYAHKGLFVRQKFRTIHEQDTYDFVSLKQTDFRCTCDNQLSIFEECYSKYNVGDTVLVREWSRILREDRLQPARIEHFDCKKRRIHVSLFGRKHEEDPSSNARPNELTAPFTARSKSSDKIIRKCQVRHFTRAQIANGDVPAPYDRDGTGDFFYLAIETLEATDQERHFAEGWNPSEKPHKPNLTGMGIFCGGGTFDRGLEEGGAVQFRYAVDWAEKALHSYRANANANASSGEVHYFLGSVNDYLSHAMAGYEGPAIAEPGDFNLLSAGSPCPGFSALQNNKLSEESKQNASMIASVVSFVDFFVPEYLILENVVTMTNGMGPQKDENVFAQIVASLVGLGYQVQQFLMDAWSYGSPQQRSRVFIIASAPGLVPLVAPSHSHAHPPNAAARGRALGTSSNGKRFGSRRDEFTAFGHVSAADAVADLPFVGDSQVQLCPQFPDHRTAITEPAVNRGRVVAVPTRPRAMGLIQAKAAGLVRGDPLEHCERVNAVRKVKHSRIFARIDPDFLFPTIVTRLAINDGINGRVVHWDQQRTLTVMEARRAQGYLDTEVLIGTPVDQLKIVGNSVDRKVALVLGLALRQSWTGSDLNLNLNSQSASQILTSHATAEHSSPAADEDGDSAREEDTSIATNSGDHHGDGDGETDSLANEGASSSSSAAAAADELSPVVDEPADMNRSTKMALNMSAEELEEIRRESSQAFKVIKRIVEEHGRAGGSLGGSPLWR